MRIPFGSSMKGGSQESGVEEKAQLGGCGQGLNHNGEERVGRRAPGVLGNSSGVMDRKALRMVEWRSFQVLGRGYCKKGVNLKETVTSSILDVLGLRFLWGFSVHSFLPQVLVTLGMCKREGSCSVTYSELLMGLPVLKPQDYILELPASTFVRMYQSRIGKSLWGYKKEE